MFKSKLIISFSENTAYEHSFPSTNGVSYSPSIPLTKTPWLSIDFFPFGFKKGLIFE